MRKLWKAIQNDERGILCLGPGVEINPETGLLSTDNQPSCKVRRTTNQSVAPGIIVAIIMDLEVFDTDNLWTPANPSRITINTAGVYLLNFQVEFQAAADYTGLYCVLRLNGLTDFVADVHPVWANASLQPVCNVAVQKKFSIGDFVEFLVLQLNSATASRNVLSNARSMVLSTAMVSRG